MRLYAHDTADADESQTSRLILNLREHSTVSMTLGTSGLEETGIELQFRTPSAQRTTEAGRGGETR